MSFRTSAVRYEIYFLDYGFPLLPTAGRFAGMTSTMKRSTFYITTILILFAINFSFAQSEDEFNEDECTFNGTQLFGKIQFVESFPDLTVQVVESFPDLKVKTVDSFPDDCGEWQIVDSFPDVKVKIVESFADIKIKFVESFPGIP